jgi:regulation of enolase protein 1 (concanavalin A-like superfamily)
MGIRVPSRLFLALLLTLLLASMLPAGASAAEQLCDPSFQDCRTLLLTRIQSETQALDIAMLFMEDDAMADAIIARHQAGVRVRMLIEPRRSLTTPKNEIILARLKAAGIPMRAKSGGGMLHWKFMIFDGQNQLEFSAANYSDYYFKPTVPYANYTDEGIYFTDQQSLIDSFRRKFDDAWVDPAAFYDYGNIAAAPARRYPLYSIDPDLSFVPFENFATRSVPLYDREQVRIDTIMYKITEASHADGLIRAAKRGVPVRLIVEGDRYREPSNFWQAFHVDRLYMAGVQIRDRAHEGFLHQKTTLLYGQGTTIHGSSNWTNESNASQYEHNYFTTKAWVFDWARQNFERKWNNAAGAIETVPFRPLPPDPPAYAAPANGATGVATTGVRLQWNPGLWGWTADVYFGTSPSPPLLAAGVDATPSEVYSFALPTLNPGTTYYWKIVSKTAALKEAQGAVYSFTTAGGTPPPPPPNAAPAVSIGSPAANSTFTAPATIDITANASDSDGSVVRVDFYSNGSLLGSDSSSPFQLRWSNVAAGSYTLTARATDNGGAATTSASVAITVSNAPPPPPPPTTLPSPWQSQDIGAVGPAGSAGASNGTFTVAGAGADVWGTADALHFAWQRLSGDADVIARVASVEYVHAWTKAGVMIRGSLSADAAQAFMLVSPAKGLAYQRRVAGGGLSTNTSGGAGTAPAWVKLERRGSTIAAFVSGNGSTWSPVGSDTFNIGTDVYVGLGVSSHDATRLATATFDNVTVRSVSAPPPPPPPPPSTVPAPWSAQDVGAVGAAGSATASNGIFTVKGAGADVWGAADAFHYVWQPLSGDADVIARVASTEYVQAWTKAGVMIRERLTAESAHAFMLVSAGRGIAFQRRVATGGTSTNTAGAFGAAPAWVKLERRANTITAFQSNDGTTWSLVGQDTFTMPDAVYVGLAVSSHDPTRAATVTFDNVLVQGAAAPPPPPPPPPSSGVKEIVLYAADATTIAGPWRLENDSTAAAGKRAWIPDLGTPKVVTPLADPSGYVEFTFTADAGRPYRLWIRGKAERNDWANDSAHVQFTNTIDAQGAPVYRIGTPAAAQFLLESCSGCGVAEWGWEDHAWGDGVMAAPIYFAVSGTQKIRIQNREDGLSIDQIVLSAERYFNAAPGPNKLDATIVQK